MTLKWEDVCRISQLEYLIFKKNYVAVDEKFENAVKFLIDKFQGRNRLARALYMRFRDEPQSRYKWRLRRVMYNMQLTVPERFYKNIIEFAKENGWTVMPDGVSRGV